MSADRGPGKGRTGRRREPAGAGTGAQGRDIAGEEYCSAREAAERLGIKPATLYAYTSRGLLQSVPGERGPARRYRRADVERLRARTQARRGGPPEGGGVLAAGEPLLDSSVTWLTDAGPLYRGHSALALAAAGTPFESVAELLWGGELPQTPARWTADGPELPLRALRELVKPGTPVLSTLPLVVAALAVRDLDRFDAAPDAVRARARALIRRMAAGVALGFAPERVEPALAETSVARTLARALGLRGGAATLAALDAALVLLADHELNASTFAARVAASTRADLYACVGAGLAAAAGPRHAAASEQVEALVRSIARPEQAADAIRERMRLGEPIPGFGHAVYRQPDPRAAPLLERARALAPRARGVQVVEALVQAMTAAGRPPLNVDGALVALAAALGLPPGATPALFVIARTAGWTAHVLEQYASPDSVLRPRARYRESGSPPQV